MTIKINYGNEIISIPSAALPLFSRASKRDVRVLLLVCSDPALRTGCEAAVDALSAKEGLTRAEIESSLSFWKGAGIIDCSDADEERPSDAADKTQNAGKTPSDKTAKVLMPENELPKYTTDQMNDILTRRADASMLVDACSQTLGRILTPVEVSILLGMLEYLGLDSEYILLLCAYCVKNDKKSLRYIEKTAISLFDDGIDDTVALERYFREKELYDSMEGRIRSLFGKGDRTLIAKEKDCLARWIKEWKYDYPVIAKAYEVTVNSIDKPSIPYANGVLERWHTAGYRTVEDIEKGIAEYKSQKDSAKSGFDTDEFFEAALRRSYKDNLPPKGAV